MQKLVMIAGSFYLLNHCFILFWKFALDLPLIRSFIIITILLFYSIHISISSSFDYLFLRWINNYYFLSYYFILILLKFNFLLFFLVIYIAVGNKTKRTNTMPIRAKAELLFYFSPQRLSIIRRILIFVLFCSFWLTLFWALLTTVTVFEERRNLGNFIEYWIIIWWTKKSILIEADWSHILVFIVDDWTSAALHLSSFFQGSCPTLLPQNAHHHREGMFLFRGNE